MDDIVYLSEVTTDYTSYLENIIENQVQVISILNSILGYCEVFIYFIVPLVIITLIFWWFIKQFISSY